MAHQYVPRPGRHPPVWLMGTGQRPGGLQKADYSSWGRISRSRRRDFSARAGHQYGSCVRAGCPGTSMVHSYASRPGPREYGSWVRSWPGRGEGSWCAHGTAKARAGGVLTGLSRRPGRGWGEDRVYDAQKKGGEAFASPDPYLCLFWNSVHCQLRSVKSSTSMAGSCWLR